MELPAQTDLENLNKHLESHPDDEVARRRKLELCIQARAEPEYVGQYPELSASQRAAVEDWVRDVMSAGHGEIEGGYVADAMTSFAVAAQLLPHDPTVSMAIAVALTDANDNPNGLRRRQSIDQLITEIEKYLTHTHQHSPAGASLHRRAAHMLLRQWLKQGRVEAALELFSEQPVDDDLRAEIVALIVKRIGHGVQALLRSGYFDVAEDFLADKQAALPALTQTLRGERFYLLQNLESAEAAFRNALAAPVDPSETADLRAIWSEMQAIQVACQHCERGMSATQTQCAFCGRRPDQRQLIADTSHLQPQPVAAYAAAGLAQVLVSQERSAEAAEVLATIRMDDLPEKARQQLHTWRGDLEQQDSGALLSRLYADVTASGLTAEHIAELEHLTRQHPAVWATLTAAERIELAERLLADGQLERAQWVVSEAFRDDPEQVRQLTQRFEAAVPAQVEVFQTRAEAALTQGQLAEAVTQINRALALHPHHTPLRLLRAQTHYRQRNYAAAFADGIQVLAEQPDNEAVRFLCASTLEHQQHFDEALRLLEPCGGDEVEALRARLERRRRHEPLLLVRQLDRTVMADTLTSDVSLGEYHGYFAAVIRAAGPNWNSHPQQWYEHLMSQNFKFVQVLGGLHNLPGDPVIALRLISTPHPTVRDYGRLTLALIFHVTGRDAESCQLAGHELWQTVRDILPGQREYAYIYEPVVHEDELTALLDMPADGDPVEIVRREMPGDAYAVAPFLPGSSNFHDLCRTLLEQTAPAMLSIHMVPTSLMAWEQTALDQLSGYGDPSADNDIVLATVSDALRREREALNRQLTRSLAGPTYIMGVYICGQHLLPEQLATILFRPAGSDMPAGYSILRPHNLEEEQVLQRTINDVTVESWGYSTAPLRLNRLRRLVGPGEAMAAFHLPIPGSQGLPGVPLLAVRPVAPPTNLAKAGMTLGESVTGNQGRPIRIVQSLTDRQRHTYIVGKTGTGKSTLLKTMALQDIEAGQGVCVVDPHGDLIDELLQRIPASRADDVILFNPADDQRPVGLNLLEWRNETHKHQIVNEFIGLLVRMYDPFQQGIVGPRFQHNVRNAMLTAMSVEGGTLIEVVRVLSDSAYVREILPRVTDPIVRSYWQDQIASTSDFHKSEILDYIVSKFSRFVGDRRVRNIIGQRHSTLDFRQIMDQRQILLVNLSKGKIGPENAQFLGLLLVQSLLMAALSRADSATVARPDFFLYVDEFQNFATELFSTMLSEGRKYGVVVTLANQYLTQVPPAIREAIFGNVGSLLTFRIGLRDAEMMALEMAPTFTVGDMVNLPLYTTCTRLLLDGIAAHPFAMRTLPDMGIGDPALAQQIRIQSAQRYGRDVDQISEEILTRYRRRG